MQLDGREERERREQHGESEWHDLLAREEAALSVEGLLRVGGSVGVGVEGSVGVGVGGSVGVGVGGSVGFGRVWG